MTGTVIWHTSMSLDGYIGDQDDSLNWAFGQAGSLTAALDPVRSLTTATGVRRQADPPRRRGMMAR